jgi:hypothetical protein
VWIILTAPSFQGWLNGSIGGDGIMRCPALHRLNNPNPLRAFIRSTAIASTFRLPLRRAGAYEPVRGALSVLPLCESSKLHAFSYFAHFFAKPRAIFRSVSLPVHEITT